MALSEHRMGDLAQDPPVGTIPDPNMGL